MKQREVKQPMRKTAGETVGSGLRMWCAASRTEVKPNYQNLTESKTNPGFIIASDAFAVLKANYVKTAFGTKDNI